MSKYCNMTDTEMDGRKDMKDSFLSLDDPRFRITPVQQMAAACTGALITSVLMTPLDVVKIRLQAQQKAMVENKCFLYCNGLMDHVCPCITAPDAKPSQHDWYHRPSQFKGTLDAFVKISRMEGVGSLWSGLSPTLVLALPATVVYFVTYEQLRSRLTERYGQRSPVRMQALGERSGMTAPDWVPLTAGCTARLWAATIVSPLELIRTKMQSKRLSYFEMHKALQSLLRFHGVKGLWKGLGPTLLRDVPFSGIYWVTYEKLKVWNNHKTTFFYSFLSGSIAGSLAATLTTPFDVVKTYSQIEMADAEIFTAEPPRRLSQSTFGVLQTIYAKNGIPGLFTGLLPRLAKVVPACAIMVSTFEYGKATFQRRNMNAYLQAQTVLHH